MAVRLFEARKDRMVQLLPRRMQEQHVSAAGSPNKLFMHALAETDRRLGQPDDEDRPGQVGRNARRQVSKSRTHCRRCDADMASQNLGNDQKRAARIVPRRKRAERLKRPVGMRNAHRQDAASQRNINCVCKH